MTGSLDTSADPSSGAQRARLGQFIRFSIVGAIQNALNIGVFAAAVSAGVPFLAASALAAVLALAASFSLNRRWTFAGRTRYSHDRAARFVAIWLLILLLALPLLAFLVEVAGLPKIPAQVIVVAIGAPLSYLAQRRWTFASDSRGTSAPS
jgi:putative flippase GtrA